MPWTGSAEHGASVSWDAAVGEELYDSRDQSGLSYFASEVHNLATAPEHAAQRANLEAALRAGWRASRPGDTRGASDEHAATPTAAAAQRDV